MKDTKENINSREKTKFLEEKAEEVVRSERVWKGWLSMALKSGLNFGVDK